MEQVIYIADDEKNIRELIAAFLSQEGFLVRTLLPRGRPAGGLRGVLAQPGGAGHHDARNRRAEHLLRPTEDEPSAAHHHRLRKDSPYDRVTGLTFGSDDYLIKPFLPLELVAR